jgi:hypothetical protein
VHGFLAQGACGFHAQIYVLKAKIAVARHFRKMALYGVAIDDSLCL